MMARYDRDMPDGGGDLGFYTGLGQEGEKETTISEQNAADAAARAAQSESVDTRIALRKLQSGQPLTDDEKISLGLPVAAPTVTDTSVADVAAKATADAAAAAAKAAADKAAADAAAAAAKTAAEIAAAKAAQLAAEKALADAKAAADRAAADKAAQAKAIADAAAAASKAERQSAYDLLYSQFKQYGLEALVEPLKGLITSGASPAEFTIKLRESDAYKKRFSANAQRVAKGLKSLSEAEYIELEDQYQDVMRRYGLPETYYARGEMGIQEGFNKFLEGDVSPVELEDRISTAQKRVLNANPEVSQALKQFYPDITNADILAYTLDPKNAIENIKRKVTTAEIGGAAIQSGLQTGLTRAEQLRAAGVTKDTAQQGFGTIAGGLERGSQLASIYGEDPYTQTTAEEEVFSLSGATGAKKQRQKITGLEKATFGGQSGISSGALARDRAGAY